MSKEFAPRRLDVKAFAEAGATLSGTEPVTAFERLSAELAPAPEGAAKPETPSVRWAALGESRGGADGKAVPWLHLDADTTVPLTCQRCLAPVDIPLQVDRWFRFAPDEDIAAAEDETAEEDVLVVSRDFDLHGLVEDELLMEIPVTPRHEVCPEPARLSAADPEFDAAENQRANPFAVLGELRGRKPK